MTPADFLAWAYGSTAKWRFLQGIEHGERIGQSFMNVLRLYDQAEYIRLAGSSDDPFYVDAKLPAALDKLTSK